MKTILKTSMAILALGVSLQAAAIDNPFAAKAVKVNRFAALAPVVVAPPAPVLTEAAVLAAGSTASHHVVPKATHAAIPVAAIANDGDDLTGAHTHFPKSAVQLLITPEANAKNRARADLAKMTEKVDTLETVIAGLKAAKPALSAALDLRELTAVTATANVTPLIDALKAGAAVTVRNAAGTADIDMTNSADILAAFDGADGAQVYAALQAANVDAAQLAMLVDMIEARKLLA